MVIATKTRRRLVGLVPACAAAILSLAVLISQRGHDDPGWSVSPLAWGVFFGCLVAAIAAAVVPSREHVRAHAGAIFAILAVTALGQSRAHPVSELVYRVGCVVFALVTIAALRVRHRPARPSAGARIPTPRSARTSDAAEEPTQLDEGRRLRRLGGGGARTRAAVVLAISAIFVSATLIAALPPAAGVVEAAVTHHVASMSDDEDETGFTKTMHLGSTNGMLKSDRVVMRIEGPPVDHLRGAVLDLYDARRRSWSSAERPRIDVPARAASASDDVAALPASGSAKAPFTTITMARKTRGANDPDPRWFLPVDACDLASESGTIAIDSAAIAYPRPSRPLRRMSFRSGEACRERASPRTHDEPSAPALSHAPGRLLRPRDAPTERDTTVDPRLRLRLQPIAEEWTRGLPTERAKLDAMARALGRFGYSLEVKRDASIDPVVDLLTVHREGHCELFASAMVLLARTQGIAARVVTGYRSGEPNPLTGLVIVRERNAHAWVEAWVEDHWEAWDPTPAIEIAARSRTSVWDHTSELFGWGWDYAVTFLARIGLGRTGAILAALVVALVVVRAIIKRRRFEKRIPTTRTAPPLPAFESLVSALARSGLSRPPWEPLERFAERVLDAAEPWSSDVAEALDRYARLRYGGIGDEASLAFELTKLAQRVTTRPEPSHAPTKERP